MESNTYLMGVSSNGNGERSGQTEICKFNVSLAIEKQVLWFEITMKDAIHVAVIDGFEELVHVAFD